MVDGGDPFYLKFWVKLTPSELKKIEQNLRQSCVQVSWLWHRNLVSISFR